MKKTVRTMIALLSLILLVLIGNTNIFAAPEDIADDIVLTNWYPLAGKYSSSTNKIIAPKSNDYKVRDTGFEFNVNKSGGVDVFVPDKEVFEGVFPVAAISSKNTVPLAGLNVKMSLAEETRFQLDPILADTRLCMLWTDTEILVLADVNNTERPGISFGDGASLNGLRYLATTPAKGLSIVVSNCFPQNIGTKVASYVYIVLHDGEFVDLSDGHPGYRWSFIARNYPDTPNFDSSGISRGYEHVNMTDGLEISVREDSTLGYVVVINGKEYYKGSEVGYFPNDTGELEEIDYGYDRWHDETPEGPTEKYLTSMTYARKDIDLSALKDIEEGYLVIGAVGSTLDHPNMNFSVDYINNVPAAYWHGEDHKVYEREELLATCTATGLISVSCTECEYSSATQVDMLPHSFGDWAIVNNANCITGGEKKRICAECGTAEIQLIPVTGVHSFSKWEITVEPTYFEYGEKVRKCVVCGTTETETIEKLKMINHLTDVESGQWYTESVLWSYYKGYLTGISETQFGTFTNMTREMFVTILAQIDGADISGYNEVSFKDVLPNMWYSNPIEWAVQNGYTAGIGDGYFGRKANVSREQVVVFFYTYSALNGIDVSAEADLSAYIDKNEIHEWAHDAVEWAVAEGLIVGISENILAPRAFAIRAEIAVIFKNYVENVMN